MMSTPCIDLRTFLAQLEINNALKRITLPIDPRLEITEICYRTLQKQGPALLFTQPKNHSIPVLGNLFGTTERITMALGVDGLSGLRTLGEMLASMRNPEFPQQLADVPAKLAQYKNLLHAAPKTLSCAPCQEVMIDKEAIDLSAYPIQTCWPNDAGPLITFGLVITKGPYHARHNIAIYRQQVIGRNKVIMRWLAHRGGALDFFEWQKAYPNEKFPIAVVIGADPVTMLAAVTPIPNTLSEFTFAGLLRGARSEIIKCQLHDLYVPARAEIVLEGFIYPGETALEGPFGDHTGYYNCQDSFPVFTIEKITHRQNPIYHSTYMGKPMDEPAVLGAAFNEMLIPLLQKQFPEIVDFYLPPEACSYRFAVVTIKKRYPGHAKRIMFGVWSFLMQFNYIKFILILDDDVNARDWKEVLWAWSTRMDPVRDTILIENTPIDYLDFASPVAHLGGKIGFDATHKWSAETHRQWGKVIKQNDEIKKRVDKIWQQLGI